MEGGSNRRLKNVHNDDFHNLYSIRNIRMIISKRVKWAEHVACMLEKKNAYNVLVRKPEVNGRFCIDER